MKPDQTWMNYWKSQNIRESRLSDRLATYQLPVYLAIKKIIEKNNFVDILSAGSGQDIICLNLQKHFRNKLHLTILDISQDVLDWNKKLFNYHGLNATFTKADIFKMPFKNNSFDIVFNTGVLEHFQPNEQIAITKEILRVINPAGFYLTANPSAAGKLYKWGMESAKKKNAWPYGDENPVTSLVFLKKENPGIEDIKEYQKDFLSQMGFLHYASPWYNLVAWPLIYSSRLLYRFQWISQAYDLLFSKLFGTYLLISVIKKR